MQTSLCKYLKSSCSYSMSISNKINVSQEFCQKKKKQEITFKISHFFEFRYSFFLKYFYLLIWLHRVLFIYLFLYLFLAVSGLRFCARAFSSCGKRGPLIIGARAPSLSWPLLLRSTSSRRAGSVAVAHGPSCSAACGILPDQGSNPCPLH